MSRFRFHIGSLLILVVPLGIGFAALREASELWDSIVLSATAGVLLVSVLLGIHRHAEKRSFWAGFAIFGWVYIVLTMIPSLEARLLTTKALVYLDSKVPGRTATITGQAWVVPGTTPVTPSRRLPSLPKGISSRAPRIRDPSGSGARPPGSSSGRGAVRPRTSCTSDTRSAHSILAWLGGKLSRRIYARGREERLEPDNPR